MDWIHLAPDRDTWRAIVNTVMNIGFRKVGLISWQYGDLLASQEVLCCMKLALLAFIRLVIYYVI